MKNRVRFMSEGAKYKMVFAFDGTAYAGWQIQPNALSVQEIFHVVFKKITQKDILVTASGRTDSGVHAKNQVAHFVLENPLPPQNLQKSLNALLPEDIRVKSVEKVEDDFHARFSACGKIYSYTLCQESIQSPHDRFYSLHFPYPLDISLIQDATARLIGKKNFRGFANDSQRESEEDFVKTIYSITLEPTPSGFKFLFLGSGFLYKMVRNLVGTLLDIGQGKSPPSLIDKILETGDRRLAGASAPPHGLALEKVFYDLNALSDTISP